MDARGLAADEQRFGDLGVRAPVGDELEHLALALGQAECVDPGHGRLCRGRVRVDPQACAPCQGAHVGEQRRCAERRRQPRGLLRRRRRALAIRRRTRDLGLAQQRVRDEVRVPGPPGRLDRLRPVRLAPAARGQTRRPRARGRRAPAGSSRAARATAPQARPPGRARARRPPPPPAGPATRAARRKRGIVASASCSKARRRSSRAPAASPRARSISAAANARAKEYWPPWRAGSNRCAASRSALEVVIAPGECGDPGAVIEDHARVRVRQLVVHRAREQPVGVVPLADVEERLGVG